MVEVRSFPLTPTRNASDQNAKKKNKKKLKKQKKKKTPKLQINMQEDSFKKPVLATI